MGAVWYAGMYCAVSATLSAGICSFAKTFAKHSHLIDKPDGVRKLHGDETPLIGGLALLVPSFAVSMVYLTVVTSAPDLITAVISAALVLVVGVVDDRSGLSPVWRLLVMMFIIFTAFGLEPLFVLHTLRLGLFHSGFSLSLDPIAMSVTVLIILGFANAANMADGMNGQLLGSVMIWCLFITLHLDAALAVPFLTVISSALVTIIFNLRGKLFSGSSGAYAASVFVALGAILAYRKSAGTLPAELPVLWFWLPVVDCVRLMVTRAMTGRSPMAGDRDHFHHMLHDSTRRRYALVIYLILLALPGLIGELNLRLGSLTLLFCATSYAGFVIWRKADGHRAGKIAVAVVSPATYLSAPRQSQAMRANAVSGDIQRRAL